MTAASRCLPSLRQMVGRAGRPQFDTEGVAVIMTQRPVRAGQGCTAAESLDPADVLLLPTAVHCLTLSPPRTRSELRSPLPPSLLPPQHVRRYEQLMTGSETVESTLKDQLAEALNAEARERRCCRALHACMHPWLAAAPRSPSLSLLSSCPAPAPHTNRSRCTPSRTCRKPLPGCAPPSCTSASSAPHCSTACPASPASRRSTTGCATACCCARCASCRSTAWLVGWKESWLVETAAEMPASR